jgi:hypothetical protein
LVRRDKGKYFLTLLGNVIHDAQIIIGKALIYYWNLKAIESIKISASVTSGLIKGERLKSINAFKDNHQIKDILMKTISIPSSENNSKVSETTLLLF